MSSTPVPPLVLSDAVVFAGPPQAVLSALANRPPRAWLQALVLATPLWSTGRKWIFSHSRRAEEEGEDIQWQRLWETEPCGTLREFLNPNFELSELAAASIRFDPGRCVRIFASTAERVPPTTKALLKRVRMAQVESLSLTLLALLPSLSALFVLDLDGSSGVHIDCTVGPRAQPFGSVRDEISFGHLARMKGLETLSLRGHPFIRSVSSLASLVNLQTLDLSHCSELQDISGLVALAQLRSLDLSHCACLRELNLSHCTRVRDLTFPLGSLTSLVELDLSGCVQLQSICSLALMAWLRCLNLAGCAQLRELPGLANHSSLRSLDVTGCRSLSAAAQEDVTQFELWVRAYKEESEA